MVTISIMTKDLVNVGCKNNNIPKKKVLSTVKHIFNVTEGNDVQKNDAKKQSINHK